MEGWHGDLPVASASGMTANMDGDSGPPRVTTQRVRFLNEREVKELGLNLEMMKNRLKVNGMSHSSITDFCNENLEGFYTIYGKEDMFSTRYTIGFEREEDLQLFSMRFKGAAR